MWSKVIIGWNSNHTSVISNHMARETITAGALLQLNFIFVKWYGSNIQWVGLILIHKHTARLLVKTNFDLFKFIKFKHQIRVLSQSIAGLVSTLHTPKFTDEEGGLINVFLHNIPSLLITYNYNSWNSLMLTDIELIWNRNIAQFSHYSIETSKHFSTSQLSAAGPSSNCVKWGYHKGKTGWVLMLFKF